VAVIVRAFGSAGSCSRPVRNENDTFLAVSEDAPSFCPSGPTDAVDPGGRRGRATGFASNRNTNGLGCQPFGHPRDLITEHVSSAFAGYSRWDADTSGFGSGDGADLVVACVVGELDFAESL
jgi:hypothetical protein